MRHLAIKASVIACAFLIGLAEAHACTSPTGQEGQLRYDNTVNKLYVCDGSSWLDIMAGAMAWTTVPLTDTNPFDLNCEYRVTTNQSGTLTTVLADWIRDTQIRAHWGYYFWRIMSNAKGTLTAYTLDMDHNSSTSNVTVTSMEKRCP